MRYRKLITNELSKNFRQVAQIVETDLPHPAADEITVKTLYAGVNATDVNISAGLYNPDKPPPFDLGGEALGQVVEVGSDVEHIKTGDYVVTTSLGGYREYGVHRAKFVIPVDAPHPEYLSIALSGLTAAFGLYISGEMTQGETVLVTAAAGATGQYAVQLAKLAGNHVIGTCGGEQKADALRALGCDRVVNYQQESLADVLQREYPRGVDIVYESVGGAMFDTAFNHLAIRGRLVVIGFISEYMAQQPELVTSPRIYTRLIGKSLAVRGMFLPHYLRQAPEYLPKLISLFKDGQLKINLDPRAFVGLESVPDAVEYLHSGASIGKVIVRF